MTENTNDQKSISDTSPLPFRIRLGVTGHRTGLNEKKVKEKVREILNGKIQEYFDKTLKHLWDSETITQNSFSILSPLAKGADRVVAEEVLKYPGTTLEVVLPLTLEDYKEDFENDGEMENNRFNGLLNKAISQKSLKKYKLVEYPENKNRELKKARNEAYEAVGQYVVDHCDILIAVWNGEEADGLGGTAQIIKYAKSKQKLIFIISTIDYEIEDGQKIIIQLQGDSYKCLEGFNKKLNKKKYQRFIKSTYDQLFKVKHSDGDTAIEQTIDINEKAKKLVKEKILPYMAVADTQAEINQQIYRWAGVLVYSLSTSAVFVVLLGTFLPRFFGISFIIEFSLLVIILGTIIYAHRKRVHRNWLENRFLAERCRAACYFIATGIDIPTIEVPPYMGTAHHHGDWMVRAFNEIWNKIDKNILETFNAKILDNKNKNKKHLELHKDYIFETWIENQRGWHQNMLKVYRRFSKGFQISIGILFSLAIIAAFIHSLEYLFHVEILSKLQNNILVFAAIFLPAMAAAIEGIRTHREYSRMEKRTENMVNVLSNIKQKYSHVDEYNDLEELVKEIDEAMLRENQDWMMLMKMVSLEPVP